MGDNYQPKWRNVHGAIDELVIGGQIIRMSSKSRNAEMDGGPFFSSFNLTGVSIEEMKADAIRQGYDRMLRRLSEYRRTAEAMGVPLPTDDRSILEEFFAATVVVMPGGVSVTDDDWRRYNAAHDAVVQRGETS